MPLHCILKALSLFWPTKVSTSKTQRSGENASKNGMWQLGLIGMWQFDFRDKSDGVCLFRSCSHERSHRKSSQILCARDRD